MIEIGIGACSISFSIMKAAVSPAVNAAGQWITYYLF